MGSKEERDPKIYPEKESAQGNPKIETKADIHDQSFNSRSARANPKIYPKNDIGSISFQESPEIQTQSDIDDQDFSFRTAKEDHQKNIIYGIDLNPLAFSAFIYYTIQIILVVASVIYFASPEIQIDEKYQEYWSLREISYRLDYDTKQNYCRGSNESIFKWDLRTQNFYIAKNDLNTSFHHFLSKSLEGEARFISEFGPRTIDSFLNEKEAFAICIIEKALLRDIEDVIRDDCIRDSWNCNLNESRQSITIGLAVSSSQIGSIIQENEASELYGLGQEIAPIDINQTLFEQGQLPYHAEGYIGNILDPNIVRDELIIADVLIRDKLSIKEKILKVDFKRVFEQVIMYYNNDQLTSFVLLALAAQIISLFSNKILSDCENAECRIYTMFGIVYILVTLSAIILAFFEFKVWFKLEEKSNLKQISLKLIVFCFFALFIIKLLVRIIFGFPRQSSKIADEKYVGSEESKQKNLQ